MNFKTILLGFIFLLFGLDLFGSDDFPNNEIVELISEFYSYLGSDEKFSERPNLFTGEKGNPYEGSGLLNNILGKPFEDPVETSWLFLDHFESALSNRGAFPRNSPYFVSKIRVFGNTSVDDRLDNRFYVIFRSPFRVEGDVKDVFKTIQFVIEFMDDKENPKIDIMRIEVNGIGLVHYETNVRGFSGMNLLHELGFPEAPLVNSGE